MTDPVKRGRISTWLGGRVFTPQPLPSSGAAGSGSSEAGSSLGGGICAVLGKETEMCRMTERVCEKEFCCRCFLN